MCLCSNQCAFILTSRRNILPPSLTHIQIALLCMRIQRRIVRDHFLWDARAKTTSSLEAELEF
jgi:hypothetical protein